MGRFHCLDSGCATVWVKIPPKEPEIIGDMVKFSYQENVSGWERPDPYFRFQYANATSFTYVDNHPHRCYFGADEIIRKNIPSARENNPEGNDMPSFMVWDSIPTGTWRGHRGELPPFEARFTTANRGIARVGHFTGAQIDGDYDALEDNGGIINGKPALYWQGEVDYLFLSFYTDTDGIYKYDVNVIEKDSCHISQVLVGRDHSLDAPRVFQVERHEDYTSVLTFHDYKGMLYGGFDGGSQIISYNRPTYLELINPRPKPEKILGEFRLYYMLPNSIALTYNASKVYSNAYYTLEIKNDYCLPPIEEGNYQWNYADVDVEIEGEDLNGVEARVPRFQAKRLLARWNPGADMAIWISNDESSTQTCNLTPIYPGGDASRTWRHTGTNVTFYERNFSEFILKVYQEDGTLIDTYHDSIYVLRARWDSELGRPNYFWIYQVPEVEWIEQTQIINPPEPQPTWKSYKV